MLDPSFPYVVEDGEDVPRSALVDIDGSGDVYREAYSSHKFQFHARYHGVLHLEDPSKVYPRVDIRENDFPQDLREAHPEFFSGWAM